jgi:hypothetical protein
MTQILNKDPKTYEIIGAAIEVILLNFGAKSLECKRFVFNNKKSVESAKSVDKILCE